MSERDDSVSLRQMLDAAQKAIQFTRDVDFEGFKNDELKILATGGPYKLVWRGIWRRTFLLSIFPTTPPQITNLHP
jgi:hypothetical protein